MELAESGSFVAPVPRIPRCFIRATNNGFTTILVVMAWFYIDVIGMLAELIFFTVTLRNRSSDLLVRHVDLLRVAFRNVRTDRPFTIDAIVILTDHLHTIWKLPESDADYSGRWPAIKSRFTHAILATGVRLNRDNRGEYKFWQRRFWEHVLRVISGGEIRFVIFKLRLHCKRDYSSDGVLNGWYM